MKWYFKIAGGHTHVRVFMNGGKCGDLCFRNEEFQLVRERCPWIYFIDDTKMLPDYFITIAPIVNRTGELCGLCDGTYEHEHPMAKCQKCGYELLAENKEMHRCRQ